MTVTDRPNYFVVDVETDSLNARTGHLLEIAGVVVNSELEVISKTPFHSVIHYSKAEAEALREGADPFVRDMHDKTGLWDRLTSGEASSLKSVDLAIYEWLAYFGRPRTMPVMGNSVRLDMNFMDEHLPRTAGFLDYHMRDVSTVAGLAADWYGVPWFEKAGTHSALADVLECIEELKHYRKHAFRDVSGNNIELAPGQAELLLSAYQREQARIRHAEEEWPGQVDRDIEKRDFAIASAIAMGVPEAQIKRFVFGSA